MTAVSDFSGPVVTLHGEEEFLARAAHLFDPRSEFICAATNLSTWADPHRRGPLRRQLDIGERVAAGLTVRKMYNPDALADPAGEAHLLALAAGGVPVRICATELPHETIIIDRRVAILAGPAVAGRRDYTVVRSPEVIAGVHALFTASWQAATDLAEFVRRRPPSIRPADREILRLLGSGRKDETAARELGMSVRTYRRRVAELMTLLGAESRFQAGARARELGLHT